MSEPRVLTPEEVDGWNERYGPARVTDRFLATIRAAWAERDTYLAGVQVLARLYAETCAEVERLREVVEAARAWTIAEDALGVAAGAEAEQRPTSLDDPLIAALSEALTLSQQAEAQCRAALARLDEEPTP